MSLNRTCIIGHLGADAKVVDGKDGKFVSFSVAVTKTYTTKSGEEKKKTTWYTCIYHKSKIATFLKKGNLLYLEGEVYAKAFITNQNQPAAELCLKVHQIKFLEKKPVMA